MKPLKRVTLRRALLLAIVFLCGVSAFAQEGEQFVLNGDFEGDDLTSFEVLSDDGSTRDFSSSDIVIDANDENNHCARFYFENNKFLIKLIKPLSEGELFKFSMRVKGGAASMISSNEVGDCTIKRSDKNKWVTYTYEGEVSSELNGCQVITFQLSKGMREFFFDDISFVRFPIFNIEFKDELVKANCVRFFDKNNDGEVDTKEAAAVKSFDWNISFDYNITSFDELRYFTGLTEIRSYMFNYYYTKLSSVILPPNIKSIGWSAFSGTALKSIDIPYGVTTIESEAFAYCPNLTTVTLPASLRTLGQNVFEKRYVTSLQIAEGNQYYESPAGSNAIINKSNNELIWGCGTTIIPSTVTSIGDDAFVGSSIANVVIPKSVTRIGNNVFSACAYLQSLIVEDGNPVFDSRNNCNAVIRTDNDEIVVGTAVSTIPASVTSIGSNAFAGYPKETITIPASVTIIGENAFNGAALTSIVIPSSVKSLGDYAFSCCRNLKDVMLSDGLESIGMRAFESCTMLPAIVIPKTVKELGTVMFMNCSSLKSLKVHPANPVFESRDGYQVVIKKENNELMLTCPATTVIPDDVKIIGVQAFYCSDLKAIAIPDGVTTIRDSAFFGLSMATSITLPASVTSIGNLAFVQGQYLKEIVMKSNEPCAIGEETFYFSYYSPNLTLFVPQGCIEAYEAAGWASLFKEIKEIGIPDGTPNIVFKDPAVKKICVELWDQNKDEELSEAEAAAVTTFTTGWNTSYNNSVFYMNKDITSFDELKYFTGLQYINWFYGCENLSSVVLPEGARSIEWYAFQGCNSLKTVVIPASVSAINVAAFRGCDQLTSIHIAPENTVYDSRDNCNAVILSEENKLVLGCAGTVIPGTVTSIGDDAFLRCEGLQSLVIPKSVTEVGRSVFAMCHNLMSLTVESGNPVFDSRDNCNAIIRTKDDCLISGYENSTIPATVTAIGDRAFAYCDFETFNIPEKVKQIGEHIVYGCNSLKSLTIDPQNSVYDSRDNCNAIIKTDTGELLEGCSASVVPEGVTRIGEAALNGALMQMLTLPATLTSIGRYAFSSIFRDVVVKATVPATFDKEENANDTPWYEYFVSSMTLCVPKGSLEAYKNAEGWKSFGKIVEYTRSDANGDGEVNDKDTYSVVNCILGDQSEDFNAGGADFNNDGRITITDALGIWLSVHQDDAAAPAQQ